MSVTVVIVDDQPLVRTALRNILNTAGTIEVVAEAADGMQAVEAARAQTPDVVLMDIRMPNLDGIQATRVITQDPALVGVRVLILTTFEEDAYVVSALRAGASGFIGKGSEPEEIVSAVGVISRGDQLLSPSATRSLIRRVVDDDALNDDRYTEALSQLTVREREILHLVARGLSNQQIAGRFVLSPLTVKTHVQRIMAKLGAHDRAQLVVIAYEGRLPRGDR